MNDVMQKLPWRRITGLLFAGIVTLFSLSMLLAQPVGAQSKAEDPFEDRGEAALGGTCDLKRDNLLGIIPPWYKYLQGRGPDNECRPGIKGADDVWLIVAAVFEALLVIAGIAAVGFIMYGGFQYVTSRGEPNGIAAAKTTITNAIFGLIFVVIATRFIGFIAGRLGGSQDPTFLLPNVALNQGAVRDIISIVLQILGALAVIMVVWGGITYIRSSGDPGAVKQAKETIIYSLVGLAIAIFAQAIVLFVFDRIG